MIKSDACFEPPLSLITLDVSISNPRWDCYSTEGIWAIVGTSRWSDCAKLTIGDIIINKNKDKDKNNNVATIFINSIFKSGINVYLYWVTKISNKLF